MDIKPYAEISDSERMERDWQAEQRAEARFLRELYNDWQADERKSCGRLAEEKRKRSGKLAEGSGKQLNLFKEAQ